MKKNMLGLLALVACSPTTTTKAPVAEPTIEDHVAQLQATYPNGLFLRTHVQDVTIDIAFDDFDYDGSFDMWVGVGVKDERINDRLAHNYLGQAYDLSSIDGLGRMDVTANYNKKYTREGFAESTEFKVFTEESLLVQLQETDNPSNSTEIRLIDYLSIAINPQEAISSEEFELHDMPQPYTTMKQESYSEFMAEHIPESQPTIVMYTQKDCIPCSVASIALYEIAHQKEYTGVAFRTIDVATMGEYKDTLGIEETPAIYMSFHRTYTELPFKLSTASIDWMASKILFNQPINREDRVVR